MPQTGITSILERYFQTEIIEKITQLSCIFVCEFPAETLHVQFEQKPPEHDHEQVLSMIRIGTRKKLNHLPDSQLNS
jgi:hypothetical protein